MASCTRNARFELRRNQSSIWTQINSILLPGEPGVELDTGQMKIGDGIHSWNDLPYVGLMQGVFTPTLSATSITESILNWDDTCTGFQVNVTNPNDYTSKYISSVSKITGLNKLLSNFTPQSQIPSAAPCISWSQRFIGNIFPDSSGLAASAVVTFNYKNNGGPELEYTSSNAAFQVTWRSPTATLLAQELSGQNFLGSYTSTTYKVNITGITSSANVKNNIVTGSGTLFNQTQTEGSILFNTPITISNYLTNIPIISSNITFTRPLSVTGSQYDSVLTLNSSVRATFSFPTFYLWTSELSNIPIKSDILNSNQTNFKIPTQNFNTYVGYISNPSPTQNQAFWFGVLSSASDFPTTFKGGANDKILTSVSSMIVTQNIDLSPQGYSGLAVYTMIGATFAGSNYPTYISYN